MIYFERHYRDNSVIGEMVKGFKITNDGRIAVKYKDDARSVFGGDELWSWIIKPTYSGGYEMMYDTEGKVSGMNKLEK